MTASRTRHVYIADAVRSPRGRGNDKGTLKALTPVELLAQQFRALAARQTFDTGHVADAVIGCVSQVGEQGSNIGKLATIAAGWSDDVPAVTVNRYCVSGLSAVQMAVARTLLDDSLMVAGGIEMMSRVPLGTDRGPLTHDLNVQRRLLTLPIGIAADVVATIEGFSRRQCDDYALESQRRAAVAIEGGHFRSIIPALDASGTALLTADETPRPKTTLASLADMHPAFATLGVDGGWDAIACQRLGLEKVLHHHHAGNSPAMADGASLLLIGSAAALERSRLSARARVVSCAEVSGDRTLALTGAVEATQLALARAGLDIGDIDLFEVNESFGALMLHYMRHLCVPHERLNVNGGAIALGHAMGSTGGSLIGMALDELERRGERRACVAICGAAGVAGAMVIERV